MSPSSPVTEHTPTPWKAEENCLGVYPISARQGPICVQPAKAFGEADAAFIVKAVNNHAPMLKSLESCAKLFDLLAVKLDRWATESQTCGWSTHQVSENLKAADDCRRYASQIRTAIPSPQVMESLPHD